MFGTNLSSASPEAAATAMAGLAMVFALKHYLADFILQTSRMARGKERVEGWFGPLLAHASCHAAMTLGIALVVAPRLWWLALIDLVVHLAVDRGKTSLARWGQWKPDQSQYWWLLGFDQLVHQLTNIGFAAALILL